MHYKQLILQEIGNEAFDLISEYIDFESEKTAIQETIAIFEVDYLEDNYYDQYINLQRINDIKRINRYFESVNSKLPVRGLFIGNVETYVLRKQRIRKKFFFPLNRIYYFLDYLFTRVFPKFSITKSFYFFITGGKNRVMSRAETLGRLYSCGFKVIKEKFIGDSLYFIAEKTKNPIKGETPSYGPIFKMKRTGKSGKIIYCYKFRTMHPYSEYLQEYIYERNQLQEGGKFSDDFRVHTMGKFFRKFWIDELPMIYNLLKGDIKIVGVRPLSEQYFGLYPEDFKNRRLNYKPGLVPPFYVDLPNTLDEIIRSEMKYFEAYDAHPLRTDIKYFFNALYNIFFKNARSQ